VAPFHRWRPVLGDLAEPFGVEAAGRGSRRAEPLAETFGAALRSMIPAIAEHARPPYLVFGHSLGALYAFEAARLLTAAGRPPELLVVSGRDGPSVPSALPVCHTLPDEEFLAVLSGFGGIPEPILAEPGLARFFLPVLRADMRIAETYARAGRHVLACPITALYASGDPLTSAAGVAAWQDETTGSCRAVEVDGGHFTVLSRPDLVREVLAGSP
jgi:surfactin synthase thioesterase subunit